MGLFEKQESTNNGMAQASSGYDPFDKIANAEATERSSYFEPGVYPILMLDVMKTTNSRQGDLLFIAEFNIIKSDVPSRAPGSRAVWIANFRHDPTAGNVKQFMASLMLVSPDEIDADSAKFMCSESNPARGRLIRLEAVELTTDKNGNPRSKPFTRHDWRPVPQEIQEQAKELRVQAGFPPF